MGKWRGEDGDANICFFNSPQHCEEKGIIMQLEPRSLASRWSEEEKGQRREGARTELYKEWQEPRTPGPTRGPLPLPRPFTVPLEGEPSPGKLACWPPSVMMASLVAPMSIGGTS